MGLTHRLRSSSFLGLPYRILNINHKKRNYLWSLGARRAVSGLSVVPRQGTVPVQLEFAFIYGTFRKLGYFIFGT